MCSTLINQVIKIVKKEIKQSPEPMTREIVFLYGKNPYLILISCLLSLQARDSVTLPISINLFKVVRTPQQMVALSVLKIEQIIKSINYYKTKAQLLQSVSQDLLSRFDGKVPSSSEELLSIKGIGIKTANLVLAEGFDIPAICVDTHVHRLSNKWGLVYTKTPEQTEKELSKILPKNHWIVWNYLLVKWGQSICKTPRIPCDQCDEIIKLLQK